MATRQSSRSTSPENDVFAIDVQVRIPKAAGTTSLSFDGLLDPPLLLHEDLQNGCGGQLWPAGMVLARYLLSYHRNALEHKSVVEIGAGGGLVGLAVARGCRGLHRPLLITDQESMHTLMEKNIALNGLQGAVVERVYDWGSQSPRIPVADPTDRGEYFDVVLAADCVYFEPAFPLLLQTLQDLIGPDTVCYFCFKKRRKADWRFIKNMQKKLDAEYVDYPERQMDQREGIYLFVVRKKKEKVKLEDTLAKSAVKRVRLNS